MQLLVVKLSLGPRLVDFFVWLLVCITANVKRGYLHVPVFSEVSKMFLHTGLPRTMKLSFLVHIRSIQRLNRVR